VRHTGRIAVVIALGVGVLAASGCGGDDFADADLEAGKQTFVTLCSSCHTLDESGRPPSNIGPNLDDSFRASREVGMAEAQFAGVVQRWIRIAQKPMPRNLVEGEEARDVAAYIASVAGRNEESAVRPAVPQPAVPEVSRQEPAGVAEPATGGGGGGGGE
jgi:mono/diheme cytochrome c family protein